MSNIAQIAEDAGDKLTGDIRRSQRTACRERDDRPIMLTRYTAPFLTSCLVLTFGTAFGQITGDFNGDGKTDLAYPSGGGSNGSAGLMLLGYGDGSFRSVTFSIPTGASPTSIVAGDFNQDGKLDLVASRPAELFGPDIGSVDLLLGNGDGTFGRPINIVTGTHFAVDVFVGDIDGDGKLDLIVDDDGAISIFLGKGNGSFQPKIQLSLPAITILAVVDINNDGYLDLVSRAGTRLFNQAGALNVFLGKGDGSFRPAASMAASIAALSPDAVITGDFNGDGKLDLVVGDFRANVISVLLGNGDGTFQSPVKLAVDRGPYSIAAGDFNHDGKLDLAIGVPMGTFVLLGNGDGTFRPGVAVASISGSMVAADFNGDGKVDIEFGGVMLLGKGDGTFSLPLTSVSAANSIGLLAPYSIASAYGSGLSKSTVSATSQPPPTSLAGTTLDVRDSTGAIRPAPLYLVSPGQINFQVPAGTAAGLSYVEVVTSTGTHLIGSVDIQNVAPGLFTANANGTGAAAGQFLRISADAVRTVEPMAQFDQTQNKWLTRPLDLGTATDQIYLLLYGTGIRGASSLSAAALAVGGVTVPVVYAGPQRQYAGLDQVNAGPLPHSFEGRGEMNVTLTVDGKLANAVTVSYVKSYSGRGTAIIDGNQTPGEWDKAASVDFVVQRPAGEAGGPLPATLYIMNDDRNLYLGVKVTRNDLGSGSVSFAFSNDNSGIGKSGDDIVVLTPSEGFFDDVRTDHALGVFDTSLGGTVDGQGVATNNGTYTFYEISHPLNSGDKFDFKLHSGDHVGFYLSIRFCAQTCVDSYFPGQENYGSILIQ